MAFDEDSIDWKIFTPNRTYLKKTERNLGLAEEVADFALDIKEGKTTDPNVDYVPVGLRKTLEDAIEYMDKKINVKFKIGDTRRTLDLKDAYRNISFLLQNPKVDTADDFRKNVYSVQKNLQTLKEVLDNIPLLDKHKMEFADKLLKYADILETVRNYPRDNVGLDPPLEPVDYRFK